MESGADFEKGLQAMPADLELVYEDLPREHSKRSGVPTSLQKTVLQCVTHAIRPLRWLDISDLIHLAKETKRNIKSTKDFVRCICGPLLEILSDETVQPIHHSFREYLTGTTRKSESVGYAVLQYGPTQTELALLCISYLHAGCLEVVQFHAQQQFMAEDIFLEPNLLLPPFTRYAASNWYIHVRKSITSGHDQTEINRSLQKLLVGKNCNKLALVAKLELRNQFSALYIGLALQLEDFLKSLLDLPEIQVVKRR